MPDPAFAPPSRSEPPTGAPLGAMPPAPAPTSAVPPLAAPPAVASPPIAVPVPSGGASPGAVIRPPVPTDPRVESFDEETYICKPGDTFKSISQEKYTSDKYERALLLFNRAHPQAAEGIRSEPPLLRPGQPVYLPPIEVLERRYPATIPDMPARPTSSGAAPPPAASQASPAPVRSYTVQGKPETFYEIAQKVLGRAERWAAIWEINRQVPDPNQPLPVGTVVRLPAS
jgi:nucleoid-associated protein YgaU